jgi:hypothetical protein
MPALLASSPNCREGSVVTIRIGASGYRFDSRRAASRPFISGIKKSITVTSGALSRHVSTALRPLDASPTTTHSAGCSSTARRWALILALSSTRKIRIKQFLPCQSMRERTAYKDDTNDVSRWGRFQDTDESAHYELLTPRPNTRPYPEDLMQGTIVGWRTGSPGGAAGRSPMSLE